VKDGNIIFKVINLTITLLCQLTGAEILRCVMNLFWAVVDTAILTVVYRTLLSFVFNRWVTYITSGWSLLYRVIILSDNFQLPIPIDLFIMLTLPLNQQPTQAKE